ncbi:TonB-dependent receptor plug domain-containing protein [Polaribacter tangerinus]|uniref:TonB-dependent receptor plug domain-containing protein n=1 Tax=Polaribacter tangerinus TaxID=1920034 RepID=UPI000B4AB8E5|nr:TonB-dependent receptor [Polaribacter tangerinus]
MKKQVCIAGVFACSFISTQFFAQKVQKESLKTDTLKEVVITATKFQLKKENTGKVIHTISQKQLQNNAGKTVIEVLNSVVGIDVRGVNSNPSEPRGINVRGGRARQVLVLIDGVPVTDQSAINQEFDLRLLTVNQIESIEILKGGASALYGSGAATAVINIILKKATSKNISGTYEVSLGTNNTANISKNTLSDRNQNINLNGTIGKFAFLGSFSLTGVDGMSSAKSTTNKQFEEDSYYAKNGLLKVDYSLNDNINIASFFNYDAFEYDFDAGAFLDHKLNTGANEQFRFGIKPSYNYAKGTLYLLSSATIVERNFNQFNSFSNTLDSYEFVGRSVFVDLVNKYEFSSKVQLITGVNYQIHSNNTITPFATIAKETANFYTVDPYFSLVYMAENGLSANAGGRLNMHNVYGNKFVYDANLAYNLTIKNHHQVKLLTSFNTAFIAPSLYQLYDGFSGNINLNPESNETFELGLEYDFKDKFSIDLVYFNRKETAAIIFDNTTFKYTNASSEANGFEFSSNFVATDFLAFSAAYTYIDREKFEDFDDYIPKNKLVATTSITPLKNATLNFTYRNVGERNIFDRYGSFGAAGEDVILERYEVLDFMANYKLLNGTATIFAAITNLLNEDYDDILGFSTRGRNYKLGVRLQF